MGYTALHRAATQGHVEAIRALGVAGSLVDCHDFMVCIIVIVVVTHVQSALYFRRKLRTLQRTLLCECTSRFSRTSLGARLHSPNLKCD